MDFQHEPVLLQEVLQWMNVREGGTYCDGTLGGGGHSEVILADSGGTAVLYGIDRDENAIRAAGERLGRYAGFHAIHGNFHDAAALLAREGVYSLDGVLLDLGVSSPQLDTPERGFSYHEDAPLDMRMDRSRGVTAAETAGDYVRSGCGGGRRHSESGQEKRGRTSGPPDISSGKNPYQ